MKNKLLVITTVYKKPDEPPKQHEARNANVWIKKHYVEELKPYAARSPTKMHIQQQSEQT